MKEPISIPVGGKTKLISKLVSAAVIVCLRKETNVETDTLIDNSAAYVLLLNFVTAFGEEILMI